jgi:hypothetical protein
MEPAPFPNFATIDVSSAFETNAHAFGKSDIVGFTATRRIGR